MHHSGKQGVKQGKRINIHEITRWAAVIIISLLTGAFISLEINKGIPSVDTGKSFSEIAVPMGAKSTVTLPDGTIVILNAGSQLHYATDYGKVTRDITFSGEGYFKVAKQKDKPFIVHTSKASVRALGTEFNVKAYPDENFEAILVEGSVLVNKVIADKNVAKNTEGESITLKPGQKVKIDPVQNRARLKKDQDAVNSSESGNLTNSLNDYGGFKIENTNPEVETSWKDNRWIIQGENLENLAILLSRKYNVNIRLQDSDLKKYKFSGIIENETIEQVFEIMKFTIPINYRIDKGDVTWVLNKNLEKNYKEAY